MLYDLAFMIFSIFYLPALIFKGKLHRDFGERFGIYGKAKRAVLASARDVIWIQAVSVGEVALCRILVPLVRKEFPGRDIVFSTITKTGNDLARKLFSDDTVVIYFPLDLWLIVRKAVSLIRPKMYIMVETEIWPNVLKELSLKAVPSILINGRISDRSFGKYKMARLFLKKTLERIRLFCMQSETDAERIIDLGAAKDKVRVTGTMKFDVETAANDESAGKIKESLGLKSGEELFVAGSTHPGEEEMVLSVYKELISQFPQLKLLIAPRHVERTGEVEGVIKRYGFVPVKISSFNLRLTAYDLRPVYILDTIGHLNDAYSLATLVFIGGSLIPHGGQNPIEPAILEKPVIFGPYMHNFKNIAASLKDRKGALQVKDEKELLEKTRELLKDKEARVVLGKNAKKTVLENRGAAARNLEAIKRLA